MFFENHNSFYTYITNNVELLRIGHLRFFGNLLKHSLRDEHACYKIEVSNNFLFIIFKNNRLIKIKNPNGIVLCSESFSIVNADQVHLEYFCKEFRVKYITYSFEKNSLCKVCGFIKENGEEVIESVDYDIYNSGIAFEILWNKTI